MDEIKWNDKSLIYVLNIKPLCMCARVRVRVCEGWTDSSAQK